MQDFLKYNRATPILLLSADLIIAVVVYCSCSMLGVVLPLVEYDLTVSFVADRVANHTLTRWQFCSQHFIAQYILLNKFSTKNTYTILHEYLYIFFYGAEDVSGYSVLTCSAHLHKLVLIKLIMAVLI